MIKEVFYDRSVPRPVQGPGQGVNMQLKKSVESSKTRLTEMTNNLEKLRAELQVLGHRTENTVLHANIDYTAQNEVLKQKVWELEHSIEDVKRGIPPKNSIFGDNSTNVHYNQNPYPN